MKKRLLTVVTILVTLALTGLIAKGEEADYWSEFDALLPPIAEGVVDRENVEGRVGLESLLEWLVNAVRGESSRFVSLLFTVLGITVIGGVVGLLGEDTAGGLKSGVRIAVTVGYALALLGLVGDVTEEVNIYLHDVLAFADGLVPVMGGVLAAGGNGAVGAVGGANMAGLLLLMEHLCVGALPPLAGACFGFSLVGSLSDGLQVGGIAKNIRGIYLTLLGVICTVATSALRLQTVLGAGRDTVAMQTARFAIGNMIPLAGNAIGATLGTLSTSLHLLKNTIGVSSVLVLVLMTVPVLVRLWAVRLALSLSGAVADLVGFSVGGKLLGDFRSVLDLLLAVSSLVTVTLVVYLGVFIRISPVGVGL